MEHITDARYPTLEGLPVCQQTLSKLHRLGITDGDINKHNFVIRDRRAILVDFDNSEQCENEKAVEREFCTLEEALRDTSGRGGSVMEKGLTSEGFKGCRFERTGSLNRPPDVLLTALANLQSKHMVEGDELAKDLSAMLRRYPRMTGQFARPGL
jgi:hypothetical protein